MRAALRDYHALVARVTSAAIFARSGAGPSSLDQIVSSLGAVLAHNDALLALGHERSRIRGMMLLIGFLGPEEALREGPALSARAIGERDAIERRGWMYGMWEYLVLDAARIAAFDPRGAFTADEMAAAIEVSRELRLIDPELARDLERASSQAAYYRATPAEASRRARPKPTNPEARRWLTRRNRSPAPLAANRFGNLAEALAFVDALYAAGAVKVSIAGENIQDDPEGAYCDALRVSLPVDPAARAAVLALTNAEARREGYDEDADTGQKVVFLWWD